jgi:hypothetical protein
MTNIIYDNLMVLKNTNLLIVKEKYYVTDRGQTYLSVTSNLLIPIVTTNTESPIISPYGQKPIELNNVVLSLSGWTHNTGTTLYEYTLINNNITTNTFVDIIPSILSTDIVTTAEIYAETTSGSGFVTIFAKNNPTGNITVSVNIFYI